jgi:hypothetical protein
MDESAGKARWLNWSSFVFALLQSVCTAVLAVSGIRVLIGVGALATAAVSNEPEHGWHQDAIRIPMMAIALAGALVNLYVLWRLRSLRKRPSSQWRVQPLTNREKRSERWQFVLAIATLVLLAVESWAHWMFHHPRPGP